MRSHSIPGVISRGDVIALYSPPNSLELFYLCKVVDFGTATEQLKHKFNQVITIGSKYIKYQNYQQKKTRV